VFGGCVCGIVDVDEGSGWFGKKLVMCCGAMICGGLVEWKGNLKVWLWCRTRVS